jgi:hypothetical protein
MESSRSEVSTSAPWRQRSAGKSPQTRGHNKDTIRVTVGASGSQKGPFVPPDYFKLRVSGSLSRQRSRVRAPSSPPYIPKHLPDVWDLSDKRMRGPIRVRYALRGIKSESVSIRPMSRTIIRTTLLFAARLCVRGLGRERSASLIFPGRFFESVVGGQIGNRLRFAFRVRGSLVGANAQSLGSNWG